MKNIVDNKEMTIENPKKFRYSLIIWGVIAGAFSAVAVVLFRILLEKVGHLLNFVTEYWKENTWFIPVWILILISLSFVVYMLLKWEPLISGSGIPQVEGEMEDKIDQKWWRVLLAKMLGGVLSVGAGLSLGREGPSIQLGAVTAKGVSRINGLVGEKEKIIITCGAGAGLAAAFNAPFAGVLFCLEEVHKKFSSEIILSVLGASFTAGFISNTIFGLDPVFNFGTVSMMPLDQYWHVIIFGILLGLFGSLYNKSIDFSQNMYQKIPDWLRLVIPFIFAGVLAFTFPHVLGGGHELAVSLKDGTFAIEMLVIILVIKFVFSMMSFGSGAPGGIFLPLLVLGALSGSVYYGIMNSMGVVNEGLLINFIILGMAGYFTAIVRAPIVGIVLISEMTGSFSHMLTLSIVAFFAYIVPDLLNIKPIYEQLLDRLLKKMGKK